MYSFYLFSSKTQSQTPICHHQNYLQKNCHHQYYPSKLKPPPPLQLTTIKKDSPSPSTTNINNHQNPHFSYPSSKPTPPPWTTTKTHILPNLHQNPPHYYGVCGRSWLSKTQHKKNKKRKKSHGEHQTHGKQNPNPRWTNPKPIAANPQKSTEKCWVDLTVCSISSKPRTEVHKPTTHSHQQKNLNHPATIPNQPTTKTHSLPPIKTHPTHRGVCGRLSIVWDDKASVRLKNFMERKSGVPLTRNLNMVCHGVDFWIGAYGEEIKAREGQDRAREKRKKAWMWEKMREIKVWEGK